MKIYRGADAEVTIRNGVATGTVRSHFAYFDKLLSIATMDILFRKEQGTPYVLGLDPDTYTYRVVDLGQGQCFSSQLRRELTVKTVRSIYWVHNDGFDLSSWNWRVYNGYQYCFDSIHCANFNEDCYGQLIQNLRGNV